MILTYTTGYGGEAVSLAINSSMTESFHTAGYANLTTNFGYLGGVVRQAGSLSFSRVFEAGHEGMSPRALLSAY
jgi:hypothetical protein